MNYKSVLTLSGYKGYLAGFVLLLSGFPALLHGLGDLVQLVIDCASFLKDPIACYELSTSMVQDVWASAMGLGILGIRHKLGKDL